MEDQRLFPSLFLLDLQGSAATRLYKDGDQRLFPSPVSPRSARSCPCQDFVKMGTKGYFQPCFSKICKVLLPVRLYKDGNQRLFPTLFLLDLQGPTPVRLYKDGNQRLFPSLFLLDLQGPAPVRLYKDGNQRLFPTLFLLDLQGPAPVRLYKDGNQRLFPSLFSPRSARSWLLSDFIQMGTKGYFQPCFSKICKVLLLR